MNQSAAIVPGQVVELPHVYTATTSGSVSFALIDQIANPNGAFTSTVFEDTNCDGAADQVMPASKTVAAGEQICLVVRTQSGGGAGAGSSYTYGIIAATTYAATAVIATRRWPMSMLKRRLNTSRSISLVSNTPHICRQQQHSTKKVQLRRQTLQKLTMVQQPSSLRAEITWNQKSSNPLLKLLATPPLLKTQNGSPQLLWAP